MIIDFHTHIFPPAIRAERQRYLENEPVFRELYNDPRARLADAGDLIRMMDEQEIDMSVVQNIQWTDPRICRLTNDYIIESVSRYPRRLIGFGMISLDSPSTACEEIEYCAESGLRGIGEIRPSLPVLANFTALAEVFQTLSDRGMIVCTHTSEPLGHLYSGKGDITPGALYPLLTAFPDLRFVCAHWGGGLPFYTLMPEVAQALRNVYFDSAASPYLYTPQIYRQAASLVDPSRILFGSDFPLLKPRRLIRDIDSLNLEPGLRGRILGENAVRLLGI